MTNGEKFKEVFKLSQVEEGEFYAFAWLPNHDAAEISIDWWNAEYKEPTTKTCKTCRNYGSHNGVCDICKDYNCFTEPNKSEIPNRSTTKNNLGVDAVSRKAVQTRLKEIIKEMETIFADIREREVNDSVCGLCEYDCDHGLDGYANECPGFEKDDCFKLNEKYKAEWLDISNLSSVTPIRPKGYWIFTEGIKGKDNVEKCSCCGSHWKEAIIYRTDTQEYLRTRLLYCPNCGADMREVVEE